MKSYPTSFSTLVHSVTKALILSVVTGIFFACSKAADEQKPVVTVLAPHENQSFSTRDTIVVDVSATDNESLKSLTISLKTVDDATLQSATYPISGATVNYTTEFVLDLPLLSSGGYYLAVKAVDESNNSTSAFVNLQLQAIARKVERYVFVTAIDLDTRVFVDSLFINPEQILTLDMDCRGAALNYRQNVFGITGGVAGDAIFYRTTDFQVINTYPNPGTSSIQYYYGLGFAVDPATFVLLRNDPAYRLLDNEARSLATENLQFGYRPVQSFQTVNHILVEQIGVTGSARILATYTRQGLLLNTISVEGPLRLASPKGNDSFYLWISRPGGAALCTFSTTNSLLETLYSRPGEELLSAMEIATGEFIIATSGGMFRFSANTGNTIVLNPSLHPRILAYNEIDGTILAGEANTAYRISPTGEVLQSVQMPSDLLFIGVDYNR